MTRYRVRAVGPAGYDHDPFPPFSSLCEAWTAAEVYSGEHPGLLCDVIDLENPERYCGLGDDFPPSRLMADDALVPPKRKPEPMTWDERHPNDTDEIDEEFVCPIHGRLGGINHCPRC